LTGKPKNGEPQEKRNCQTLQLGVKCKGTKTLENPRDRGEPGVDVNVQGGEQAHRKSRPKKGGRRNIPNEQRKDRLISGESTGPSEKEFEAALNVFIKNLPPVR